MLIVDCSWVMELLNLYMMEEKGHYTLVLWDWRKLVWRVLNMLVVVYRKTLELMVL